VPRSGNVGGMSAGLEVTTGGVRLAYEVSGGSGVPPMVLLHALGERGSSWAGMTPWFAPNFRVFTPDMRGHGDSDWPGTYSFELMRDDVLGLLDQLRLDKITLVGHSMGGAVALQVAMAQPDRIERLIVEDACPPYPRERPIPERPAETLDFDWPVVPAIVGQVNQGDPDAWDRLGAITARTLLIGGGLDSHIRQDKLAEAAGKIPDCTLVTIPAGHNVHAARPDDFAGAILSWLRG
jgi:3-oxoadipate enol-lactonase